MGSLHKPICLCLGFALWFSTSAIMATAEMHDRSSVDSKDDRKDRMKDVSSKLRDANVHPNHYLFGLPPSGIKTQKHPKYDETEQSINSMSSKLKSLGKKAMNAIEKWVDARSRGGVMERLKTARQDDLIDTKLFKSKLPWVGDRTVDKINTQNRNIEQYARESAGSIIDSRYEIRQILINGFRWGVKYDKLEDLHTHVNNALKVIDDNKKTEDDWYKMLRKKRNSLMKIFKSKDTDDNYEDDIAEVLKSDKDASERVGDLKEFLDANQDRLLNQHERLEAMESLYEVHKACAMMTFKALGDIRRMGLETFVKDTVNTNRFQAMMQLYATVQKWSVDPVSTGAAAETVAATIKKMADDYPSKFTTFKKRNGKMVLSGLVHDMIYLRVYAEHLSDHAAEVVSLEGDDSSNEKDSE